MIVTLDNSLFTSDKVDEAILIQVLKLGDIGKIRVRCSPAYRPNADQAVNRWIEHKKNLLNQTTFDKINNGLIRGTETTEYVFPDGIVELRVRLRCDGAPDWSAGRKGERCLPLTDTSEKFLRDPLSILVEDSDTDWAFLKKVVPDVWKKWFQSLSDKGWIMPDHCGGVPKLEKRVRDTIAPDPWRRHRSFAFFDSESNTHTRRMQGRSSRPTPSEKAEELCKHHHIPYHRLYRRATENYVPKSSLTEWVRRAPPSNRERHQALVVAFLSLPSDEHRHFFPCKGGISQAEREEHAGEGASIYGSVDAPALQKGFTHSTKGSLADVWTDESYEVRQTDLAEDGSLPEIQDLFLKLLAAV